MKLFTAKRSRERTAVNGKKAIPTAVKVIYTISAACIPLYLAFWFSERFADFFNRYISSAVRALLAHLTSAIPFSFAECLLLLLPIWVVLVTRSLTKRYGDTVREMLLSIVCICSAFGVVFTLFTLGFAPAYRGSTLDSKLGLEQNEVSANDLYDTALWLSEKLEEESKDIYFGADGFSVMPYNYTEMNSRLLEAYGNTCDKYKFVQRINSRLKPVMLSPAMSYTHITGVYTFFTGEANINVAFPDYTLAFTAAHELSHQRGIARENEANFMAFIVCMESDDAYIRYCAYLNMYEYVSSALYRADGQLYSKAYSTLPLCVRGEMQAYSAFYEQYRDSAASNVSEAVNDTFLKLHGTEGTKSYGMVVDLAVAYYKNQ